MDINFETTAVWPITRKGRKMRTTRGPGFTDLKVSARVHMSGQDRHRFTHPFSSKYGLDLGTALKDSRNFVPALLEMGADTVTAETSWWVGGKDSAHYDVTYILHFEGIGHSKLADSAEKQVEKLRIKGDIAGRATAVALQELDRVQKLIVQDTQTEKLRWLAQGLVEEARKQAKAKISYDERKEQLNICLADETQSIAMNLIAEASQGYAVEEEDLRRAVEGTLEMKSLSLMGM